MDAQYFDLLTGQDLSGAGAVEQARHALGRLETAASLFQSWQVETDAGLVDVIVDLPVVPPQPDSVGIPFKVLGRSGLLIARIGEGAWIELTVELAGTTVFSAAMHRPYEQFELWPSVPGEEDEGVSNEAPGIISKRLEWISLSVLAWPKLARLTKNGWLSLAVPEVSVEREE